MTSRRPDAYRMADTTVNERTTMTDRCEHFDDASAVAPRSRGCEECRSLGTGWTELRVCATCGHVGCCEDSPHAHALQHYRATGHPIIVPLDRKESWAWCYVHNRYFQGAAEALRPPRGGVARWISGWLGRSAPK